MTTVSHRFPAGPDSWSFWREAVLRTTGFPASGLDLLAARECASQADGYLDGRVDEYEFVRVFDDAVRRGAAALNRIAAELSADPALAVPDCDRGLQLIASLVARRLLSWDANMPVSPHTAGVLSARIAAIGDGELRHQAEAGLNRLTAASGAAARAAGDPVALAAALAGLDAEFTAVTGAEPRRRLGQAYAGRGVCYEDTTRDLCVTVGRTFLDEIAPPARGDAPNGPLGDERTAACLRRRPGVDLQGNGSIR